MRADDQFKDALRRLLNTLESKNFNISMCHNYNPNLQESSESGKTILTADYLPSSVLQPVTKDDLDLFAAKLNADLTCHGRRFS